LREAGPPGEMVPNFALKDPHLEPILEKLHKSSESQHPSLIAFFILRKILEALGRSSLLSDEFFNSFMRDKSVALERDKSQLCYLLVRATGAKTVVEVGSSFGVSTIYLAAGVRDNSHNEGGVVIATENEPAKIVKAKENWEEAKLSRWIKLLEGDVLITLKDVHLDDPIDLVLMDIWAPMVLPSLKNLLPKMKKGTRYFI
jgi:predicted O-methyltransferase YrrM